MDTPINLSTDELIDLSPGFNRVSLANDLLERDITYATFNGKHIVVVPNTGDKCPSVKIHKSTPHFVYTKERILKSVEQLKEKLQIKHRREFKKALVKVAWDDFNSWGEAFIRSNISGGKASDKLVEIISRVILTLIQCNSPQEFKYQLNNTSSYSPTLLTINKSGYKLENNERVFALRPVELIDDKWSGYINANPHISDHTLVKRISELANQCKPTPDYVNWTARNELLDVIVSNRVPYMKVDGYVVGVYVGIDGKFKLSMLKWNAKIDYNNHSVFKSKESDTSRDQEVDDFTSLSSLYE